VSLISFVTAVNCIDGRVQEPVLRWMKKTFKALYVDMITEPGPVGVLDDPEQVKQRESIRKRIAISLEVHDSPIIALVAHSDCAGNPVADSVQKEQLSRGVLLLREWFPQVSVHPLWIDLPL